MFLLVINRDLILLGQEYDITITCNFCNSVKEYKHKNELVLYNEKEENIVAILNTF